MPESTEDVEDSDDDFAVEESDEEDDALEPTPMDVDAGAPALAPPAPATTLEPTVTETALDADEAPRHLAGATCSRQGRLTGRWHGRARRARLRRAQGAGLWRS